MALQSEETRQTERGGFLLFLVLATIVLALVVWPFAQALLWSALAAIVFLPVHNRILARFPGRRNTAAAATLAIITGAVIAPAIFIGSIVVEQATDLYRSLRDGDLDVAELFGSVYNALPSQLQQLLEEYDYADFTSAQENIQEFAQQSAGLITQQALTIGGGVFSFVLGLGVGIYILYFLLRDGDDIGTAIGKAMPLPAAIGAQLKERFILIVRATIKGSFVVALVQGTLGAITFWIVGMPSVVLFGLLMAIASLIPALGAGLVWVPAAIYLLANGDIWQAIVVVVSGIAIIGMADNILRPILVGRDTGIPDWLVLVTTLGGIASFGLSGVVLGPLAAGLFLASWTLYAEHKEAEDAKSA